jgi:Glyoxalase/Bleomycin resistance protein/Dioxygenase superfamily
MPIVRHPIFQYAYVVDDIETAATQWATMFDAGPFFVAAHHRADTFSYRGTPIEADVTYAFGYAGDCQIQLVQQHDDQPSIYRDMYATGATGFHHVAVLVKDYAGERQRLVEQGFEVACELHANDIDACYFDTRAVIGGFTELHSHTERIVDTFQRWRRAHLDWDGQGGPIRAHTSGT